MSQAPLSLSIGLCVVIERLFGAGNPFMRSGSPFAIYETVSGDNNTCELMKTMTLEAPDMVPYTSGVTLVEAK